MFLHGGLFHVAGNMLYLWIFGDNVEDSIGVLGAYLLLFPYASVLILVIFGFFVRIVRWPAMIVLGLWIVIQSINGLITARASAVGGEVTGGTAWFAHIGGFLAGIILLFLMRPRRVGRL
jgi:rhomboid family protein